MKLVMVKTVITSFFFVLAYFLRRLFWLWSHHSLSRHCVLLLACTLCPSYQIFLYNKILLENKLLLLYEVGDLKNLKPHPISLCPRITFFLITILV